MMPLALLLLPHAALATCDSVGKFVPLDFNTSLVRSMANLAENDEPGREVAEYDY